MSHPLRSRSPSSIFCAAGVARLAPAFLVRLWAGLCFGVLAAGLSAAEPPRGWEPDAFLPLTEQRIAALPPAEQGPWRAYWEKSQALAAKFPGRDLVNHAAATPLDQAPAGAAYSKGLTLTAKPGWYGTEEARVAADHVVNWQTSVGGWTKGGDYKRDRLPKDDKHNAWSTGTFDNDSTTEEMRFLARVIAAFPGGAQADSPRVAAWRASFLRGLDYIFAAQYPNGGFPQVYPLAGGYHDAVTFNDNALVHVLELLRDIFSGAAEFAFVPSEQVELARAALERGIRCVLASQVRGADGRPGIWGQQHDPLTLRPCAARNFEPTSLCAVESVDLVIFLMTLPRPSPEIVAAIEGAVDWFPSRALHGVAWNRQAVTGTGLEPRAGAPDLWARLYELGTDKSLFGERDRTVHYTVTELSRERREGYGWYASTPAKLPALYEAWKKRQARISRGGSD